MSLVTLPPFGLIRLICTHHPTMISTLPMHHTKDGACTLAQLLVDFLRTKPWKCSILRASATPCKQLLWSLLFLLAFYSYLGSIKKIRLSKLPVIDVHASGEEGRKIYLQSARKLYRNGCQNVTFSRRSRYWVILTASHFKDHIWVLPASDGTNSQLITLALTILISVNPRP